MIGKYAVLKASADQSSPCCEASSMIDRTSRNISGRNAKAFNSPIFRSTAASSSIDGCNWLCRAYDSTLGSNAISDEESGEEVISARKSDSAEPAWIGAVESGEGW